MKLGSNIQHLRRQRRMTQEQLAEAMEVSRQTVSRWEADEAVPELTKLLALCELFSCKLDGLVREDLVAQADIYSQVTVRRVAAFTMARYVMITPNPEDDVKAYLDVWARRAGLPAGAKRIGWDFPFVSSEQQNRFGLRGYAAAWVLPEGFTTAEPGVEIARQETADYAVVTIREPFVAPFERIPGAYRLLMAHLEANGFREKSHDGVLACFEHEYVKDGVDFMDVYIHVDSVSKADLLTSFS